MRLSLKRALILMGWNKRICRGDTIIRKRKTKQRDDYVGNKINFTRNNIFSQGQVLIIQPSYNSVQSRRARVYMRTLRLSINSTVVESLVCLPNT